MRTKPMILLMSLLGFLSPCQAGLQDSITQKQPDNIIQFACQDFSENADRCTPYTCDTPSVSDPTVKMTWSILNSTDNHHCLISYTIADVGLKTSVGDAEPITKTCEYDDTGIGHLNDLMDNMQSGYFLQSELSEIDGSYNCTVTSEGNPLKPEPYSVLTDN